MAGQDPSQGLGRRGWRGFSPAWEHRRRRETGRGGGGAFVSGVVRLLVEAMATKLFGISFRENTLLRCRSSFTAFAALFVPACQGLEIQVLLRRENRSAVTCCHFLRFVKHSWKTQGHFC